MATGVSFARLQRGKGFRMWALLFKDHHSSYTPAPQCHYHMATIPVGWDRRQRRAGERGLLVLTQNKSRRTNAKVTNLQNPREHL